MMMSLLSLTLLGAVVISFYQKLEFKSYVTQ